MSAGLRPDDVPPPEFPGDVPPGQARLRRAGLGELLAEFKRRRVFRVLVGYGIFSFAVLQVIEPIMHGAHLPEWVLTAVLVALALGFPVATVLAWVFDLTAQGVKRTPPVGSPGSIALSRGRVALYLVGLGLVAVLPGTSWHVLRRGNEPRTAAVADAPSVSATPSIAVLPFADMSPGHDQEYFADGVAEEILNALAQVEGLRVPGRTSSFWFKGKEAKLADIGRELNVTHVLEGSVRRAGARLRVTAQVVKVADGYHLWSETFDRDQADIFAVQDQVARAVVEALKVKLLTVGGRLTSAPPTASLGAYEQYLLGTQLLSRYTVEDIRRGLAALEKAVALDPGMAPAWVSLSFALWLRPKDWYTPEEDEMRRRATAAADRAVTLAPRLPEAYAMRALVRSDNQWDYVGADVDSAHALDLAPNSPFALVTRCYIQRTLGRLVESAAACRKAIELEPLSARHRNHLSWTLIASGDLAQARVLNDRALELSPDSDFLLVTRCTLDFLEGHEATALTRCGELKDEEDRLYWKAMLTTQWGPPSEVVPALAALAARYEEKDPYTVATAFAWHGDADRAMALLERAHAHHFGLADLKIDWTLRKLRGDPRYQALLKKMKLPPD